MSAVRLYMMSAFVSASLGGAAGCRHATPGPDAPQPGPAVQVTANDREFTVVRSDPPPAPELDAAALAPRLPPLEAAPGAIAEAEAEDAPAKPLPSGRLVGVAQLEPQRNETMRGMATVLDDPNRGPMMEVNVELGGVGSYEVMLLDASRRCNERDSLRRAPAWRPVKGQRGPSFENLGVIQIDTKGGGKLMVRLPPALIRSGVGALQERAVVIYDGPSRPLTEKRALSCGPLRFGPDESPAT